MGKLGHYMELFKIKQSTLLVLSGVFGVFIAGGLKINIYDFLTFLVASILSVFGTTGLNMYYDRDIDSKMFRTRNRPLPANKLDPDEAFFISLVMAVIGIIIGFQINFWTGMAVFLGFFIDALLYTVLLKRKSVLNIVIGAFAGGMLPFGGYVMVTSNPDIYAVLLMLIVTLWAMIHIWFISIYYLEDYRIANIPMFPVVFGEKKTAAMGILQVLLIWLIVYYFWFTGFVGIYSLAVSAIMTVGIIVSIVKYLINMNRRTVRGIFKFLSPYLGILLLTIAIERSLFILA
ncbi:MAG: heme o synthase [Candidatus Njordarchaeia archaeon]